MPGRKHTQLDSDKRLSDGHIQLGPVSIKSKLFGKIVRKILETRRGKLLEYQKKQQKEVENFFHRSKVKIHSYYHEPDGTGSIELEKDLELSKGKERIIFLHPSIVEPVDISQTFPNWLNKTGMFAMRAMDILARKALGDKIKGFEGVFDVEKRDEGIEEELLQYGTIPGYTIHTTLAIQTKLFGNNPIEVFVVKGATSEDLQVVLNNSDKETILVLSGHGNYHGVLLTDGFIQNHNMSEPRDQLKAIIQHTCGNIVGEKNNCFGRDWAMELYGWETFSGPVKYLLNTLRKKK